MKSILLLLLLLPGTVPAAEALPVASSHEISRLFDTLEHSGCRFFRNGSWYDATKASAHLRDKYTYLLKHGLITSTESFIDRAATRSSMSGRPYLVKCDGEPPIESRSWFGRKLMELRIAPANDNN